MAELDDLLPLVYDELKRLARRQRHASDPAATLSTTELVHEAFLKLAGGRTLNWESRAHLFGAAARAMRQVLVDFARRRRAAKRGGAPTQVTLGDEQAALSIELDEILAVDAALEQLERTDPRLRLIVDLRFFAGMPEADIAQTLGLSVRTVERDWLKARLLLLQALGRD